jgi:hypothetical protein
MPDDALDNPESRIHTTLSGMSDANEDILDEETIFDILSNRRRRQVIYYLQEHGGQAPLREVANAVAGWEEDEPSESVAEKDRRRVYVSLYQSHVPRLTDAGLLEHDDSGVIELTDRVRFLNPYLAPHSDSPSWQIYYLAIGLLGILFGVLILLDFPPVGVITGVNLLLIISFGTVILALIHARQVQSPRDAFERDQLN